jgi:uncharacterized protein YgiB involved in biofilm formation
MKRSRKISLILLSTVGAVAMSACNEVEQQPTLDGLAIYESVEQCRTSGRTDCDSIFDQALENHIATAPRFSSRDQCVANGHAECVATNPAETGGSSVWLPAIVGFMAGRMLGDSRPVYVQNSTTSGGERRQEFVAGGTRAGAAPVVVSNRAFPSGSRVPVTTPPRNATVTRGGFGAAGASAAGS